jgi:hypothetical protein
MKTSICIILLSCCLTTAAIAQQNITGYNQVVGQWDASQANQEKRR